MQQRGVSIKQPLLYTNMRTHTSIGIDVNAEDWQPEIKSVCAKMLLPCQRWQIEVVESFGKWSRQIKRIDLYTQSLVFTVQCCLTRNDCVLLAVVRGVGEGMNGHCTVCGAKVKGKSL